MSGFMPVLFMCPAVMVSANVETSRRGTGTTPLLDGVWRRDVGEPGDLRVEIASSS